MGIYAEVFAQQAFAAVKMERITARDITTFNVTTPYLWTGVDRDSEKRCFDHFDCKVASHPRCRPRYHDASRRKGAGRHLVLDPSLPAVRVAGAAAHGAVYVSGLVSHG